uniref:Uncharacterized protein LOC111101146 n=1 Tax=Crassostrea virginica TaxID=6565 RepID=A0A8B8AGS5_CRAVI|nr:uncharacterized protein LOC111101146 [Crassostrea virginica]
MAAIWIPIFGLAVWVTGTLACDDLDAAACVRLASTRPNMCNDTCFATVCKRYCGKCPLKCYTCTDIANPQMCNVSTECPSTDHRCISVKSYTNDFRLVYKLGCAPSMVCSGTNCCTQDLCNNHANVKRKTMKKDLMKRNKNNHSLSVESKRQTLTATCADVDNLACTLLFTSNTNICQDDCVANVICPRLCGKCTECYDCDHVLTTERCNHSRICQAGEVCFTLETLNFDLEHGYRMGCVHQRICDGVTSQVGNVFGRRSNSIEVSMTGGCCHSDLCNHHKLTPLAMSTNPPPMTTIHTMATTTAKTCRLTGGCPFVPSARYNGQCYFLGNYQMTWLNAKAYCEAHCSNLAVFRDENDLRHVMDFMKHDDYISHLPNVVRHNIPDSYVDAVNPAHAAHFLWSTTLEFVPDSMFDDSRSISQHNCAVVVSGHRQLQGVNCLNQFFPLCQTTMK